MSSPVIPSLSTLSRAADAQWIEPYPGERITVHVRGEGGEYAFVESIVEPMVGPPLHIHHDADEVFHVLEGTMDFICDGRRSRLGPGDVVRIPKGSAHAWRNFSDRQVRMMVVLMPGGFEQMFFAMRGVPPEQLPALAATFDAEIVGPMLEPMVAGEE